ncbi:MAG: cyanoexosortase A system-associated protein [Cyanobacteria bacterium P01_G01_bin.49]
MSFWSKVRNSILAFTLGSTLFVLGKSFVVPTTKKVPVSSFTFPEKIPLPGWQLQDNDVPTDLLKGRSFQGRGYEYRQKDLNLAIAMHYVPYLHPNETLFRAYDSRLPSSNDPIAIMRHKPETGFYMIGIEEKQAYLRACINPRGPSAITYQQFIQNRYTDDLKFSRFLPVLLGHEPLRDYRCLWTHLSIPVNQGDSNSAYQVLEKAWGFWYDWWHNNFPKRNF